MSMWGPAPGQEAQASHDEPTSVSKSTTGLFTVPVVDPGIPLHMHLYISNFADELQSATVAVNRFVDQGNKQTIAQGELAVPGDGAVSLIFNTVSGETLEVALATTSPSSLVPSLDVIETFVADGATLPVFALAPGRFAALPLSADLTPPFGGVAASASIWDTQATVQLTSGIFDVPQGVANIRPVVDLYLSNFVDEEQTATIVVNALVEGSTQKMHVSTQEVTVLAHEAEQITLEGVEALPIEVNVLVPVSDLGIPLLEPSINVTELTLNTGDVQVIGFIGPNDFVAVESC